MATIMLQGFLGRDPEERMTANNHRVNSFSIGVNGRDKKTQWYKINMWGDQFDKQLPYLKKGNAVSVVGKLNLPKTYLAKDGEHKVELSVTALSIDWMPRDKTNASPLNSAPAKEEIKQTEMPF